MLKKSIVISTITLLIFVGIFGYLLSFRFFVKATPPFLSGWEVRKPITITNVSSQNLSDYEVDITIAFDPRMNTDFSDLRFTDNDGTTLLNHGWDIDEKGLDVKENGVSARATVKVPSIPANATKTIYLYYDNPSAASTANLSQTLTWFDHFTSDRSSEYDHDRVTWDTANSRIRLVNGFIFPKNFAIKNFVYRVGGPFSGNQTVIWRKVDGTFFGRFVSRRGETPPVRLEKVVEGVVTTLKSENPFLFENSPFYSEVVAHEAETNFLWHHFVNPDYTFTHTYVDTDLVAAGNIGMGDLPRVDFLYVRNLTKPGPTVFEIGEPEEQVSPFEEEVALLHNNAPTSIWIPPITEPVNPVFGNYLRQERDVSIPGRGPPLLFERTYNSQSIEDGPLGAKWTHTYNIHLKIFSTAVILVDADGREDLFTLELDGTYTPQKSVFDQLVKNQDDTFTLTKKNQIRFQFDSNGKLTALVDRNNNQTILVYNQDNQLIHVIDSTNRSLNFDLNSDGRITTLIDPSGQEYMYQYDELGDLISFTDPTGVQTQYNYDERHNLISLIDANNHTVVTNTYDDQGRVIAQLDAKNNQSTLQYDPEVGVTVFIDPLGNQTEYHFDEDFRVIKQVDAQNNQTLFTFDENNNRTSITDANGNTTLFTYDQNGNLAGITDPLSNILTFTYDDSNNLLSSTNAKGDTTLFAYDQDNNLIKISDALDNQTIFIYDQFGQLIEKQDAKNNATSYTYDQHGNLEAITDALSNTTTFDYDIVSRLITITDAQANTAFSDYDEVGRLTQVIDPLDNQTSFVYDSVGNPITITDAKGNLTLYSYDEKNNLSSAEDALESITTYQYDALDNRIAILDANNHTTTYAYDSLNRLTQTIDSESKTISYTYDGIGNVVSFTNGKGEIIAYQYDANNRLVQKTFPDSSVTSFTYDENGNIITAQNQNVTYTYEYDTLNRATSVDDSRFGTIAYTYDDLGNRNSLTDPQDLSTTYKYDPLNRLIKITDPQAQNYLFTYDSLSRRIRLSLPNALTTAYTYDSADRLLDLHTENARHRPISQFSYTYDQLGNRLSKQELKKSTNYQYDALSRLLKALEAKADDDEDDDDEHKPKPVENYVYDPVGNRLAGPKKQTYTYNTANELLQFKDVTLQYDLNGNVIIKEKFEEEEKKLTTFSYDPENRLVQVIIQEFEDEELEEQKTIIFLYDPFGRRIEKRVEEIEGEEEDEDENDNEDEDDENEKEVRVEQYLYDNEDILAIYDNKGRKISSFIHGPGIDEPLAITQKQRTSYYLFDGLGSVVGLSDDRGRIIQRYEYDSFGNLKDQQDRIKQPYTFTGREYDKETGLYYYRARYYDPEVGRFTGRDVFRGFPDMPQTSNRYLYVTNNPANQVDPSGKIGIIGTVLAAETARFFIEAGINIYYEYQISEYNVQSVVFDAILRIKQADFATYLEIRPLIEEYIADPTNKVIGELIMEKVGGFIPDAVFEYEKVSRLPIIRVLLKFMEGTYKFLPSFVTPASVAAINIMEIERVK
ncbi:DUF2341 domain-containing protein [Patescibacteria group bacterium AH-259-L07]|nr:DUF2341 domain-containing protein [Patescibacteria group bacterium AH-259-L07]